MKAKNSGAGGKKVFRFLRVAGRYGGFGQRWLTLRVCIFWSGQKTFEKRQDNASQCIEGLLGKLYSWPWPDCPSIISPSHHLK